MSITAKQRQAVIKEYQRDENDSGSPEVQVAILTHRIRALTEHLKANKHDYSSQRGLLQMVSTRTRLLRYLASKNRSGYLELIKRLGLRK